MDLSNKLCVKKKSMAGAGFYPAKPAAGAMTHKGKESRQKPLVKRRVFSFFVGEITYKM